MAEEDEINTLLTAAAVNGLKDVKELMRTVYFRHPVPVMGLLSTLARLRFLEVNMLRGAVETLGAPLGDLRQMADDLTKAVCCLQVSSGTMTADEVLTLYPGLDFAGALEQAAAQAAARPKDVKPEPAKYAEAVETLNAAEKAHFAKHGPDS